MRGQLSRSSTMSELVEFMQDKWRFWLSVCKLSEDGKLMSSDLNQGAEYLVQEYNLSEGKAEEVRNSFKHLGAILLGNDHMRKDVCVSTGKVVANLTGFLLTNRAEALEYIDSVVRHMFIAVDTDGDDFVDEKEFYSVCKCLLIHEKYWTNVYHRVMNPETGRVNITTAVVWWVDFLIGVDKSNWDELRAVFNS